jgi:hypothetical protein
MLFKKVIFRERVLHPHAEGIPPLLLAELPNIEADEGTGAPDGGGGGNSAVGSLMPIFLLTTSKVLSIFLRAHSMSSWWEIIPLVVHDTESLA